MDIISNFIKQYKKVKAIRRALKIKGITISKQAIKNRINDTKN
jgi:hypothetical protein